MRALPEREHREWRARASERYGVASTEGLLMVSRDGVNFKRWNEAFLRPGIEREGTWAYGHQLSSLANKPVRLRFELKDADVYAFQFLE